MNAMNKRSFGGIGEELACDYLKRHGYKILHTNYRIGRFGEIDIIATEGEYTCFVEVKTRTGKTYGMPSEAVNNKKIQKIRGLALIYSSRSGDNGINFRFDIVEIIVDKKGGNLNAREINLIKNAF